MKQTTSVEELKGDYRVNLHSYHTAMGGKSLEAELVVDDGWGVQFIVTMRRGTEVTHKTIGSFAAAVRVYNNFDASTTPSVLTSRHRS